MNPVRAFDTAIPVVTVCEVLANLQSYNGKYIAIVARLAETDHGGWLSEDRCEHKLMTGRYVWSNVIWLEPYPSSPPQLTSKLDIQSKEVKEKLKQVVERSGLRKTDQWVLIHGILDTHEKLETHTYPDGSQRGIGFGHLGGSPAQLFHSEKDIKVISEDEVKNLIK